MALSDAQIDTDVRNAIKGLISAQFIHLTFSWSLVPNKSTADDGLGVTQWMGWMAMLDNLVADHLVNRTEYQAFRVGPQLVTDTHGKNLTSLRIQLGKRLKQCATNC